MVIVCDIGNGYVKAMMAIAGGTQCLRDERGRAAIDTVLFDDNGKWLFGHAAKQHARVHPERGVRDFKRSLGTTVDVGRGLTALRATQIVLGEIKKMAENQTREAADGAVLLKPGNFTDVKTADLEAAANAVGLKVIAIISEAAGATLAVVDQRPLPPGVHLVLCVDIGAMSTDFTVARWEDGKLTVLASDGVTCGGEDQTQLMMKQVAKGAEAITGRPVDFSKLSPSQLNQLVADCEEGKVQLSSQEAVMLPVPVAGGMKLVKVSRTSFETESGVLFRPAVDCVKRVLATAKVQPSDLAMTVFTGSPANSPFLRGFFESELGVKGSLAPDPSLAGVQGALLHAQDLARQAGGSIGNYLPPKTTLTDCSSHDIGVAVASFEGGKRVVRCRVLIPKGTPIPHTSVPRTFKPESLNQSVVAATFLQGDNGKLMEECLVIGSTELTITPEAVLRDRIEIVVEIDRAGLTTVTVRDTVTGNSKSVTLKKNVGKAGAP